MRQAPLRVLVATPVIAAVLLGAGLTWLASVTSRTLRERNDAVRQGVLLRLGHDLESELREVGPGEAASTVERFLADHGREISGIALVGAEGVIAQSGRVGAGAQDQPAMLGPAWRPLGGGFGRGRGPGRGTPPTLRLQPTETLGSAGRLARVVVVGAVVAALGLVTFSLFAVAGLAQRQRLAAAEAEHRRLEVLALAGAGLAHRIRNPLAAIIGTTQLLLEGATPPADARARRILEASQRIDALLGALLAFARPPEASPEVVDLAALATRVLGRTAGRARLVARGAVPAWADSEHVESILEELVANARAFDPDGELEVEARLDGHRAVAEVRDRGPGLAVDPERAFDPYVTTRPEGAGLGLATVRALARANGGEVTLASRRDGGCVARLVLPAERA